MGGGGRRPPGGFFVRHRGLVRRLAFLPFTLLLLPGGAGTRAAEADAGAKPPRTVQVARPRALADGDGLPATLYIEDDVKIAARTTGVIAKVLVDRGAMVRAGQPVAVLETDVPARELEIAEHELRLAEEERARMAALHDKQVVSDQDFRRVDIARDLAKSKVALARAQLDLCTVRAPFDGRVVERWAVVGQHLTGDDGTPLFRIAANKPLRARVDVPEAQLALWTVGAVAAARPLAGGGAAVPAKVVFRSPAVDAASGTAPVIVELTGHHELLPGAAVGVDLGDGGPRRPVVLVPAEALVAGGADGTASLFVAENGVLRARRVRVVARQQDGVRVQGDVGPDDLVVIGAAAGLADGEPVRVVRASS